MEKEFLSEREAGNYSPLTLAFLGDSVYDTLVREYLLRIANMPVAKLHSAKIQLVCAEFQSAAYERVADALTEKELAVLKRGRNATGNTVPKHADAAQYRRATALECLFGYLYLTGKTDRIAGLFDIIIAEAPDLRLDEAAK
ncbi:MAG: ribonuclease III [Ruminococcus sp.]|nr:ribonuclease III [Ruminococcus sp.]